MILSRFKRFIAFPELPFVSPVYSVNNQEASDMYTRLYVRLERERVGSLCR